LAFAIFAAMERKFTPRLPKILGQIPSEQQMSVFDIGRLPIVDPAQSKFDLSLLYKAPPDVIDIDRAAEEMGSFDQLDRSGGMGVIEDEEFLRTQAAALKHAQIQSESRMMERLRREQQLKAQLEEKMRNNPPQAPQPQQAQQAQQFVSQPTQPKTEKRPRGRPRKVRIIDDCQLDVEQPTHTQTHTQAQTYAPEPVSPEPAPEGEYFLSIHDELITRGDLDHIKLSVQQLLLGQYPGFRKVPLDKIDVFKKLRVEFQLHIG
jgi:hypothetical protein